MLIRCDGPLGPGTWYDGNAYDAFGLASEQVLRPIVEYSTYSAFFTL